MKKFLLACITFLSIGIFAQDVTAIIGAGASSVAGTNGTPIYRSSSTSSFHHSKSIQLLTQTDLNAANVMNGYPITAVGYYKNDGSVVSGSNSWTLNVYLKNTSSTALATGTSWDTMITGATLFYTATINSTNNLPSAAGWVNFTNNTANAFTYTGGAIEVYIEWVPAGTVTSPFTSGSFTWKYDTTTAVQAMGTSNSTPVAGTYTAWTTQTRRYQTQITFTPPPCSGTPAPGNTLASATSGTCPGPYSTTLSLQNGTTGAGVTYQWYKDGTAIAGATNSTYTANVTAAGSYYAAVTCSGSTGTSTAVSVSAPLAGFVPTYTNDFAAFPGSCWSIASGGSPATGSTGTTAYWFEDGFLNNGTTGAAKINLYSTNRAGWLKSPSINLSAGGYRVKFDYGVTQFASVNPVTGGVMGSDDVVQFVVSQDGGTTWTVLQTWNASNTPSNTANSYILNLTSYTGSNTIFAFYGSDGTVDDTPDFEFFVDNFVVETIPACTEPSALTITGFTTTSASLSWTAPATVPANGYTVYYSTSATAPTGSTVLDATNSVNVASGTSTTVSGLSANTTYYFWVRSNCSSTAFSPWVGSQSAYTGYCTPAPSSVDGQGITNVTFGVSPNVVNNTTGAETGNYGDYSSMIGDVSAGVPSQVDITYATGYTYDTKIWVDLNNNLVFEDSEALYTGTSTNVNPTTLSATITIPSTTALGNYRMRIGGQDSGPATPCYTGSYGTFEDYTINVVAPPACLPPSGVTASSVTDTSATLGWTAPNPAPANGYEYYYSTTNTAPTGSGTANTTTTVNLTSLTPATTYYVWVRSVCSGSVSTWTASSFTTLATPPANDNCSTATALTPGGTFAQNAVTGTTVGATAGTPANPTCGGTTSTTINVWYTVTVPASGNVTIETNSVSGSPLTDTVLSVYTGTDCSSLTSVACDDDSSTDGNFSLVSLTGQTPGSTIYVSVWRYGSATDGQFKVSAYDASLATSETTANAQDFKVYPNPFTDVLNISDIKNVKNVNVVDMSGRIVKSIANPTRELHLGDLKAGMYILKVDYKDGTSKTVKAIKK